jgi:hypothetical protein
LDIFKGSLHGTKWLRISLLIDIYVQYSAIIRLFCFDSVISEWICLLII